MGRKSKYKTHVEPRLSEIRVWYQLLNEAQIAKRLGISQTTFQKYKAEHTELQEALMEGRDEFIESLKMTLKKKAQGFTYEETKTTIKQEGGKEVKVIERYKKYAQPDTGSIHLLLKNLDENWHNDDAVTIRMKEEQLQITKDKAEAGSWVSGDT